MKLLKASSLIQSGSYAEDCIVNYQSIIIFIFFCEFGTRKCEISQELFNSELFRLQKFMIGSTTK